MINIQHFVAFDMQAAKLRYYPELLFWGDKRGRRQNKSHVFS